MRILYTIGSCIALMAFFSSNGQVAANHVSLIEEYREVAFANVGNESQDYVRRAKFRAEKSTGRLNIFVFSREKQGNLASFLIKSSTGISSLFNKKIRIIKANSTDKLVEKIEDLMEKNEDKMIGTLWLDSHGRYIAGHSLLMIGDDTVDYKNIRKERIRNSLAAISAYCDEKSVITMGACYSGATYVRPANDKLKESRMNGDSLMIEFAKIFPMSPILGSASWIMTKPFLFGKKWGLAGHPMELKFKDEIYKPAWEKMGIWRKYDPNTQTIGDVNTVYLDRNGDIKENATTYLDSPKAQKIMEKNIKKLKPGMYVFDVQ